MAAFLRKPKFPISNDDIFEIKNFTSRGSSLNSEGRARGAVAYKNYKI